MLTLLQATSVLLYQQCGDTHSYCTTTQVGSAIVTAAHCMEACGNENVRKHELLDLAVLEEGEVSDTDCVDTEVGQSTTAMGWAYNGRIHVIQDGTVTGVRNTRMAGTEFFKKVVLSSTYAHSGMSGGPLYSDGRVVGMVYGTDLPSNDTAVLAVSEICEFLRLPEQLNHHTD